MTRERWRRYWASPISQLVEVTDSPALERMFRLYDERDRAGRTLRRQGPLVRGSQGQPVLNPVARYVAQCDAEIRSLEDRFGLSARARLQLGITVGDSTPSIEARNRELNRNLPDDGDDPRLPAREA